ncbi:MAG: ABC transporter ATP-binding protein [Rickettsiales bacterium]|jgi:ABC-2 type transport system ATP-binding protein|nr:ABC transporter ATP-binding protein [Rickettsiales bacterium]
MNLLEIRNVNKKFASRTVLRNINLAVGSGEIFGLIGLNGAGKTTLIKIILDLLTADGGECLILNKSSLDPAARSNIFYLPEKFQPPPNLKAIEFLKFFTAAKEIKTSELRGLCEALSLEYGDLGKRIGSLSKGMAQKIGLIASVLDNKKLIILDEPMSGLDPRARIYLKKFFLDYKNRGNSIFFSSHILSDVDEICDRIAIINDAEIGFTGSPAEFKKKCGENSLERAFLREIGETP